MKQFFFLVVLSLSFACASAQKTPPNPVPKDTVNKVVWTFSEEQVARLFAICQVAQEGLPTSEVISAKNANILLQFSDSLMHVIQVQGIKWHPAPPPVKEVPKVTPPVLPPAAKDSTQKKAP